MFEIATANEDAVSQAAGVTAGLGHGCVYLRSGLTYMVLGYIISLECMNSDLDQIFDEDGSSGVLSLLLVSGSCFSTRPFLWSMMYQRAGFLAMEAVGAVTYNKGRCVCNSCW